MWDPFLFEQVCNILHPCGLANGQMHSQNPIGKDYCNRDLALAPSSGASKFAREQ
jgi:hypothetical protein